jgi:hypothetical protein
MTEPVFFIVVFFFRKKKRERAIEKASKDQVHEDISTYITV